MIELKSGYMYRTLSNLKIVTVLALDGTDGKLFVGSNGERYTHTGHVYNDNESEERLVVCFGPGFPPQMYTRIETYSMLWILKRLGDFIESFVWRELGPKESKLVQKHFAFIEKTLKSSLNEN
jgi:hypothetical protein